MTIAEFDHLDSNQKIELLSKCCGSSTWVNKMVEAPIAEDLVDLEELAEHTWYECSEDDWKEAFAQHPKIGNIHSLKEKYGNTKEWAANEQSGVENAQNWVLQELAKVNAEYENKFGFIFIVCASGKTAEEMLAILKRRIVNDVETEINIAAAEQLKITILRLEKLFL